jgi:hypothetical protein
LERFRAKHALGLDPGGAYRFASRKRVATKNWSFGSDSVGTERAVAAPVPPALSQYIVRDCGDAAIFLRRRFDRRKKFSKRNPQSIFGVPIARQNIEMPRDLVVKPLALRPIMRNGLSTLIIRVKCRLSILRHRPVVSFSCEASVVCLTGQKDEANALR